MADIKQKDPIGRLYLNKSQSGKTYVLGRVRIENEDGSSKLMKLIGFLNEDTKNLTKDGQPSKYFLIKEDDNENNTQTKDKTGQTGFKTQKEVIKSSGQGFKKNSVDVGEFPDM